MKKTCLFLLLSMQLINAQVQPKKPWLFFAYIAAVNNLYEFASSDINEMKKGTNKNVNTLIFLHGLQSNNNLFSKKIILVNNKTSTEETLDKALDSGALSTFIAGVKWAISQAPHDYIAIDLWNHGAGILNPITKTKRGICFDDVSRNYLTDKHLRYAFEKIVKLRNGKKIDILGFDACLMGSIECNASWADYAKYIVGSEETIPGYGWGYETVLKSLTKSISPKNFASAMVESYKKTYTNVEADFTLSAIDASKIKPVANNVNLVAQLLINLLSADKNLRVVIKNSLRQTVKYYEPYYIDLGNFYQNLIKNLIKFKSKVGAAKVNNLIFNLNSGINLVKKCVINNAAGPSKKNSLGISIYFPTDYIDSSYSKLYWTQKYPNWLRFLQMYLGN
jgi:hypothetical protein